MADRTSTIFFQICRQVFVIIFFAFTFCQSILLPILLLLINYVSLSEKRALTLLFFQGLPISTNAINQVTADTTRYLLTIQPSHVLHQILLVNGTVESEKKNTILFKLSESYLIKQYNPNNNTFWAILFPKLKRTQKYDDVDFLKSDSLPKHNYCVSNC